MLERKVKSIHPEAVVCMRGSGKSWKNYVSKKRRALVIVFQTSHNKGWPWTDKQR